MKRLLNLMTGVFAGVMGAMLTALLLGNANRLLAETQAPSASPSVMSYQGFLAQSNVPMSGTVKLTFALYDAPTGGNKVWEEVHTAVFVSNGYFAVMLGSQGTPLAANTFSGSVRYLQVKLNEDAPLPRQRLATAPYAFQADQAVTAISATQATQAFSALTSTAATTASAAPWGGLTGVPPGFADGTDDVGGANYDHYIVVAKSGGHYTSVARALGAASNGSVESRFLVWVAPGIYSETERVIVPGNVHLKGSGAGITVIQSARSGGSTNGFIAGLTMLSNSRLSDLSVVNIGNMTGNFAIAIYVSTGATRTTVIEGVAAESSASSASSTGNYAIFLSGAGPSILRSNFRAVGASFHNAALASIGGDGLIEDSRFEGIGASSGTGVLVVSSGPTDFRGSYIYGDYRGITSYGGSIVEVHSSKVQVRSFSGSSLFNTADEGAVRVANSGVFYVGATKHLGNGGLKCINNFKADYTAASNGITPATACN
jgi:hypothetical protein